MTKRKTDGERIAEKAFFNHFGFTPKQYESKWLSKYIDRLIRKRMAEAWGEGWFASNWDKKRVHENPYRGRAKK